MTPSQMPSDYRILVPRDWFRIDLTHERWRRQLKAFVDKESTGSGAPAHISRGMWATLRNTAERSVARGALEIFLKTEPSTAPALPASLLISLVPAPAGSAPTPEEFAQVLAQRADEHVDVEVVDLPAGRTVRLLTDTTMDFHVSMPGEVGYLHLAFSCPVGGIHSPMGGLCEAMASSLRWV